MNIFRLRKTTSVTRSKYLVSSHDACVDPGLLLPWRRTKCSQRHPGWAAARRGDELGGKKEGEKKGKGLSWKFSQDESSRPERTTKTTARGRKERKKEKQRQQPHSGSSSSSSSRMEREGGMESERERERERLSHCTETARDGASSARTEQMEGKKDRESEKDEV